MIRVYRSGCTACEPSTVDPAEWSMPPDTLWIDLFEPTREEDAAVERALGLSIPTREEMADYLGLTLETVSRLFSRFARDGLIRINQREVRILDQPALKQLLGHEGC